MLAAAILAAALSGEAPRLTVRPAPASPKPGGVVVLEIGSDRPLRTLAAAESPKGFWLEPGPDASRYRGLLGIDLDREAGPYRLALRGLDAAGHPFTFAYSIRVAAGHFTVEPLRVDPGFVEPPAERRGAHRGRARPRGPRVGDRRPATAMDGPVRPAAREDRRARQLRRAPDPERPEARAAQRRRLFGARRNAGRGAGARARRAGRGPLLLGRHRHPGPRRRPLHELLPSVEDRRRRGRRRGAGPAPRRGRGDRARDGPAPALERAARRRADQPALPAAAAGVAARRRGRSGRERPSRRP